MWPASQLTALAVHILNDVRSHGHVHNQLESMCEFDRTRVDTAREDCKQSTCDGGISWQVEEVFALVLMHH